MRTVRSKTRSSGLVPPAAVALVLGVTGMAGAVRWHHSEFRIERNGPICTITRDAYPSSRQVLLGAMADEAQACRELDSRVSVGGPPDRVCAMVDLDTAKRCVTHAVAVDKAARRVVTVFGPLPVAVGHVPKLLETVRQTIYRFSHGGDTQLPSVKDPRGVLVMRGGALVCLGVVADEKVLLTAAHCLQPRAGDPVDDRMLVHFEAGALVELQCQPAVAGVDWKAQAPVGCQPVAGQSLPVACYQDIAVCRPGAGTLPPWPRAATCVRDDAPPSPLKALSWGPWGEFVTESVQRVDWPAAGLLDHVLAHMPGDFAFTERDSGGPLYTPAPSATTVPTVFALTANTGNPAPFIPIGRIPEIFRDADWPAVKCQP